MPYPIITRELGYASLTAFICAAFYVVAAWIVQTCWPLFIGVIGLLPAWIAAGIAYLATASIFWIVSHMQNQRVQVHSLKFLLPYWAGVVVYVLSTMHPAQYNAGVARMELALAIIYAVLIGMACWRGNWATHTLPVLTEGKWWLTSRNCLMILTTASLIAMGWSLLVPYTTPLILPVVAEYAAEGGSLLIFWTIIHMQWMKRMDPLSATYNSLIMLGQGLQLLSTLSATQYNLGTVLICFCFLFLSGKTAWQARHR